MNCCHLAIFITFISLTQCLQGQVINVPKWPALMGERGWPIYYTEEGKVGILNTWGCSREVHLMKFTDEEFFELKKWGIVEKKVFMEKLFSGELIQQASEKRAQHNADKQAARARASNIHDIVQTVDYTSQNQVNLNFNDGTQGSIAPGGLQLQGTITISRFNERAAEIAKACGHRIAEFDQTTYIKVLQSYRSTQMMRAKTDKTLKQEPNARPARNTPSADIAPEQHPPNALPSGQKKRSKSPPHNPEQSGISRPLVYCSVY